MVTLYKYINIIQSPQQFPEILAPCRPFLLHLLTHRRIFKNLTPYISTPSIILPPIRMFPRRRGVQSMCRECAERAERVQRVRRECAGSVSATGRRPIDGFGGNDMTISGLRRGPKGISKIKISETAEAESENTGKQTEGGGKKTTGNRVRFPVVFPTASVKLSVLEGRLVRNGQLLASLSATRSQHLAAVGRSHSLAESVLVDPLAARRLISSFHCHNDIVFVFVLLAPAGITPIGFTHRSAKRCSYSDAECKGKRFFLFRKIF